MTVEIGSWYIVALMAAIGIAVAFFAIHLKTQQYRQFVLGKVKVIIHRNTGWPLTKVVEEMPDGWVRVDKGDYKLPREDEQKAVFDKLSEEEKHRLLGEKQVIPPAMEFTYYPDNAPMGVKSMRVPIRTAHFYENDPRPRTWLREHETEVTAVVAQAHTRQMDALTAGIRAEQLEKQNKHMMEALANTARKNIVYLLGFGSVALNIVILIILYRGV